MGVFSSRLKGSIGDGARQAFDLDEKWSNLYREREKNHLYKWVGVRKGGDLIAIYEKDGEDGVLRFAEEKIVPMLYNEGREPQLIKFSDFVKWKKTVNVQLGLAEEGVEMNETRFREHYASWKLNKRGLDGENIIHLLLNREQPVCYEIARILLNRFPCLAHDVYLGDEMFGQSALHLAIVHDDYETCQLLLHNGADVNSRACGNFFLPEDFKTSGKVVDYQGYAYYGEYPLAFAACFSNKDIYDMLIQYGADANMQSMYSYAVRHWAKPAAPNIVNNAGYTPLTLATKLGRKEIFDEMLELMKVEFWRFSDMTCSAYPLATLDTIRPDGSTNYDSALMTVINGNTSEHLDMIGSEVIQRLLADKWKAFASRKLFERLALLILHLSCLCLVVYLRPTEKVRLYMEDPRADDWFRTVCEVITILNCLFFVFFQQLGELRTQGIYGYIRNLRTAPAKIIFIAANILLLLCIPFRFLRVMMGNIEHRKNEIYHNNYQMHEAEEALFVFALPGSWIFLLFFARSAKLTGPFVQMIYSMIAGDMIRFAIISAIFLVSFSQDMDAKQQLEANNTNKCDITGYTIYTYNNFLETFITLFRASMGGYDYEEFSCANYEALTKTLFVLYMFVMPIMMINILIAMMGNTYTTVIAQAEKAWRQQYAQIVMVLERSVNKEKLAACQLEYSIKLNEGNETGLETRGLMVIKQTKKTRAKQRKQAINNWKKIGRKVIQTIDRVGTEHAMLLLHSHDRMVEEAGASKLELLQASSRARSPSTRLHTSRRPRTMVGGKDPAAVAFPTSENTLAPERAALAPPPPAPSSLGPNDRIQTLRIDHRDDNVDRLLGHISAPSSLTSEGAAVPWPNDEETTAATSSQEPPEERTTVKLEKSESTSAGSSSSGGIRRVMRVRGFEAAPSHEIPNLPATSPPTTAVAPKIRHDMFKRRDSPHGK